LLGFRGMLGIVEPGGRFDSWRLALIERPTMPTTKIEVPAPAFVLSQTLKSVSTYYSVSDAPKYYLIAIPPVQL
jgi:hypothetical protein